MTLSQQTNVVLDAIQRGFLQPRDIAQWADAMIVVTPDPPLWLIELSTLHSDGVADFESILREQEAAPLTLRQRIQIIVLAHEARLLSLQVAVMELIHVVFLDDRQPERGHDEEALAEALVWWDCQEGPDILGAPLRAEPVESPLKAKFLSAFREYLADADEVAAVLPFKRSTT